MPDDKIFVGDLLWGTRRRRFMTIGACIVMVIAVIGATSGGDKKAAPKPAATAAPKPAATAAPKPAATAAPKPAATAAPEPAPVPKPAKDMQLDDHSRRYIALVQTCQVELGLLILDIQKGQQDTLKVADKTTTARDACDNVRSELLNVSTDHFDDQALIAWGGVDRAKSGLNALLAYLDNPVPSKLIETQNKLQEGDQNMAAGIAAINAKRRASGFKAI